MRERGRDRERDPKPVGDLLRTLVAGRGWNERMSLQRLRESWSDVVGEHLATRSEPVKLARGVLSIRADGSAWASEITLLGARVAANASRFLGADEVRECRVVAGSPARPDRGG